MVPRCFDGFLTRKEFQAGNHCWSCSVLSCVAARPTGSLAQFFDNPPRRIRACPASQAHSGVCSRPTQKQVADGSAIARPVKQRPHGEELVKGEVTMEDVATGETVSVLQILGRDDLSVFDKIGKTWRVLAQGLHHGIAQVAALALPI